jgi:hypothetical protein
MDLFSGSMLNSLTEIDFVGKTTAHTDIDNLHAPTKPPHVAFE